MSTQIFVNLAVENLDKSKEFFTRLGFRFEPKFTSETGACMVISDTIFVMLLTKPFFKTFIPTEICDARKSTEALICLSCKTRQDVDSMVKAAVDAGGNTYNDSKDHGFMYQHGFQDLDGHIWELVHLQDAPELNPVEAASGHIH
ncbi:MAG: glyoxalase/bleomycin resistance/extradiol dioxygenase family protein [Cyanobacteria bacterium TGS_CYA1]|nr:glyoxalase/bleomycin resistance/extradiol dioxygenase family protein [Cyanobacteria bacterium TGS_CYA1]